jgi:hypothetical protein
MAETSVAPWTLNSDARDVAACSGAARLGVTRGEWDDPDLAALVAPPMTVSAFTTANGRHRAVFVTQAPAPQAESLPTWRDLAGALAPA